MKILFHSIPLVVFALAPLYLSNFLSVKNILSYEN